MEQKTEVKKQIDKELMLSFWRAAAEAAQEDFEAAVKDNNYSFVAIYDDRVNVAVDMIALLESNLFEVKE